MGGLIVSVVNELRSQLILRIPCQRCESDEKIFTFFRWLENAVSKNFARSHCKVRAKLDYFLKKFSSYFAGVLALRETARRATIMVLDKEIIVFAGKVAGNGWK